MRALCGRTASVCGWPLLRRCAGLPAAKPLGRVLGGYGVLGGKYTELTRRYSGGLIRRVLECAAMTLQTAVGKLLQAREETSVDADEQANLHRHLTHVRSNKTEAKAEGKKQNKSQTPVLGPICGLAVTVAWLGCLRVHMVLTQCSDRCSARLRWKTQVEICGRERLWACSHRRTRTRSNRPTSTC
jgi:hypothetical protein